MDDKLLKRIKALLNKANCKSVTPEEGQAFMEKAQQMMTQHGLEMADLPADDPGRKIEVNEEEVQLNRRRREHDRAVARILIKCLGIYILHGTNRGYYRISYIGTPEDVALAKELQPLLAATMSRGFLQWQRDNGITKWSSNEARAYYHGLANGYINASEEGKRLAMEHASKEQKENLGLILVEKAQLVQAFVDKMETRTLKPEKIDSSTGAARAGYLKGASLELVPKKKLK